MSFTTEEGETSHPQDSNEHAVPTIPISSNFDLTRMDGFASVADWRLAPIWPEDALIDKTKIKDRSEYPAYYNKLNDEQVGHILAGCMLTGKKTQGRDIARWYRFDFNSNGYELKADRVSFGRGYDNTEGCLDTKTAEKLQGSQDNPPLEYLGPSVLSYQLCGRPMPQQRELTETNKVLDDVYRQLDPATLDQQLTITNRRVAIADRHLGNVNSQYMSWMEMLQQANRDKQALKQENRVLKEEVLRLRTRLSITESE